MDKLIKTLLFVFSLVYGQQTFAAACSAEPITGTTDCWAVPDTYTITLYEMGICNDISDQSSSGESIDSQQTSSVESTDDQAAG